VPEHPVGAPTIGNLVAEGCLIVPCLVKEDRAMGAAKGQGE